MKDSLKTSTFLFSRSTLSTTQGLWMHIRSVKKNVSFMNFQIWSDVPAQCYVRLRIFCVRLPFSWTLTTNSTKCMQSVQVHFFCMLSTLVSLHDETSEVNLSPNEEQKHYFSNKLSTWHLHSEVTKTVHFQHYKTCSSKKFDADTTWS